MSDDKKSSQASLAQRASIMVQGGAGGSDEDGLGADWLRCIAFRSSGSARYSARVLKGSQSLRTC